MQWFVLWHDFNQDKIEHYNIFQSCNFKKYVEEALKNYVDYDSFKEEINKGLKYSFWSKCEYEMLCKGLGSRSKEHKIDVYYQVVPNLETLCRYIIDKYNEKVRKKL